MTVPIALTIAGSDSSGGAGIQADLKAFSALGVYGASVIAALTAQNTQGVQGIFQLSPDFVARQLDSVFSDLRIDAVKIGMLGDAAIIEVVADALERHRPRWVVLDPVMVAKSGDRLLDDDGVQAMIKELLPRAMVVTPNIPEAEALTGLTIRSLDDVRRAAARISEPNPFSAESRPTAPTSRLSVDAPRRFLASALSTRTWKSSRHTPFSISTQRSRGMPSFKHSSRKSGETQITSSYWGRHRRSMR